MEWGVWGVVDYGLGVVVGLMGEWWPVRAQAGPLGGGAESLSIFLCMGVRGRG